MLQNSGNLCISMNSRAAAPAKENAGVTVIQNPWKTLGKQSFPVFATDAQTARLGKPPAGDTGFFGEPIGIHCILNIWHTARTGCGRSGTRCRRDGMRCGRIRISYGGPGMSCGRRQKAWESIGIHCNSLGFLAFCASARQDRLR